MPDNSKTCKKCNQPKDISEFNVRRTPTGRTYTRATCKDCEREQNREYDRIRRLKNANKKLNPEPKPKPNRKREPTANMKAIRKLGEELRIEAEVQLTIENLIDDLDCVAEQYVENLIRIQREYKVKPTSTELHKINKILEKVITIQKTTSEKWNKQKGDTTYEN